MIVLGIESTAHTFGVGIINATGTATLGSCTVLTNITRSYSSPTKGMIPNEIVDHHNAVAKDVLQEELAQS